jgi:hypothetical protein
VLSSFGKAMDGVLGFICHWVPNKLYFVRITFSVDKDSSPSDDGKISGN